MYLLNSSKTPARFLAFAFLLISSLVMSPISAKNAEQPGVVLREKISTIDSHEALIADLEIPANASLPAHQHPGDEFLYMLDGQVELSQDGLETIVLTTGQGHRIPAGTVHFAKAGAGGARAIIFRVHPEGEAVTNLIEN